MNSRNAPSIEALTVAVEQLRETVQAQSDRIRQLEGGSHPSRVSSAKPVSRAGLLKAAGVGAVAVAAAGLEVRGSGGTALATNGGNLILGQDNNAEHVTSVLYDGSANSQLVVLLANDSTWSADSSGFSAALGGWAGAGTTAGSGGVRHGVYGYTDHGGGNGVVGWNNSSVVGSGAGVLARNDSAGGFGLLALNDQGVAVKATNPGTRSSPAILGEVTGTRPAGYSSAIRGQNNGTAGNGIGVWGSQAGSGWGGYFTAVGGTGVVASGGAGRGGAFTGARAAIRLTPSDRGTHPVSGLAGDLFVDKTHRLWFCKQSGARAVWKQVV